MNAGETAIDDTPEAIAEEDFAHLDRPECDQPGGCDCGAHIQARCDAVELAR
jgi:hypothetical protein